MLTKEEMLDICICLKDYGLKLDKEKEQAFMNRDMITYRKKIMRKTEVFKLHLKLTKVVESME